MKKNLNSVQCEDQILSKLIEDLDDLKYDGLKDGAEEKIQHSKRALAEIQYEGGLKDPVNLSKITIRELVELNETADKIFFCLNFLKYLLIFISFLLILGLFGK